jgi:hypothetical protein
MKSKHTDAMGKREAKRHRAVDHFKLRGHLEWVMRDARTGEIVGRGKKKNTVTAGGRGWALARIMSGSNAQILSAIAIGSVSTAPTSNDSNLAGYDTIRNAGTQGLTTATNTACTYTMAVSFASNETWTNSSRIGEFALYNSSGTAGATMFNRLNTTTYINFATSNTLAITVTITN